MPSKYCLTEIEKTSSNLFTYEYKRKITIKIILFRLYEINKNKTNYFIVFLDPFLPDVSDDGDDGDVELSSIEAAEEEALS